MASAPRLSLAQQLAQIDDAAPLDFDPEALETYVEDDVQGETGVNAAREHYVDVGPSALRKLQDSLSDPKYDGVRTSRKALLDAQNEEGSDFSDKEDGFRGPLHGADDSEADSNASADEPVGSEGERSESDDDGMTKQDARSGSMAPPKPPSPNSGSPATDEKGTEDLTSTLKHAREADKKKGRAVAKQIALWEVLLDSRIQIQKAVVAANKLPSPGSVITFLDDPESTEALLKLSQEALALADDLSDLQEKLFQANEGITPPARKRRKMSGGVSVASTAEDLISACESATFLEQIYHPQLVQTLAKWSAKIQAVAPSVLLPSNRGAFAKGKQQLKSAVQLVDDSLQDHEGLLARTRLRRAPGTRLNPAAAIAGGDPQSLDGKTTQQPDLEIFDDTDFYQKMLRDLIDARGGGEGKDSNWIAIQKQKKSKKDVDTKASKGRKIRYQVYEKIQNFMVPIPPKGGWHEEQIDELFSSLLGKGFENALANHEGNTEEVVAQDGFRVFG